MSDVLFVILFAVTGSMSFVAIVKYLGLILGHSMQMPVAQNVIVAYPCIGYQMAFWVLYFLKGITIL